jgi:hypothetical protein
LDPLFIICPSVFHFSYIVPWGAYFPSAVTGPITTNADGSQTSTSATIFSAIDVANARPTSATFTVNIQVIDASGSVVATSSIGPNSLPASTGFTRLRNTINLNNVNLWNPDATYAPQEEGKKKKKKKKEKKKEGKKRRRKKEEEEKSGTALLCTEASAKTQHTHTRARALSLFLLSLSFSLSLSLIPFLSLSFSSGQVHVHGECHRCGRWQRHGHGVAPHRRAHGHLDRGPRPADQRAQGPGQGLLKPPGLCRLRSGGKEKQKQKQKLTNENQGGKQKER